VVASSMNTQPETIWGSLLLVATVFALMSAAVFSVSLNYGWRRLAWLWAAIFLASTVVAAYSFWRLV
jgi:cobalamin biosynthesis protein CobD/CbiB